MSRWTFESIPDQTGRRAIVTGANTGIGYEAAKALALKGAEVTLACRSADKGREALDRLKAQDPPGGAALESLDLADLGSVEAFADRYLQANDKLDLLILNAGVMVPPQSTTAQGFELQFGVNHLGHFALTGHLLDLLAATPGARIVNVSSGAHRGGRIDFDDPHAAKSYSPMRRYQMSKAANLYFTFELARRLKARGIGVTSVACHPGVADTELSRTFPGWFRILAPLLRPLFNSPAEGALPTLMAATAPDVEPCDYYGPVMRMETARGAGPARISSHVRDEAVARELWDLSEELTGVSYLAS